MFKKKKFIELSYYFWIALFIGTGLRVFFFASTTNNSFYGGDQVIRLAQTYDWLQGSEPIPGSLIWLPFHHILLAFFTLFGLKLEVAGRLITLLLGIGSLPIIYAIVKKLYNERLAILSIALLAINPFHIKYSTITMSEVPFVFFVSAVILSLVIYLNNKRLVVLLMASLLAACACLIRYEGWMWTFFIGIILIYKTKAFKPIITFWLLPGLSILLYAAGSFLLYGIPFKGVNSNNQFVETYFGDGTFLDYAIMEFSNDIMPFWWWILFGFGIIYTIWRKKTNWYFWLGIIVFAVLVSKVLTGSLSPYWRFFILPLILSFPVSLTLIDKYWNKKYIGGLLFTGLILHCSWMTLETYEDWKNQNKLPVAYYSSAYWIKQHRLPYEGIIYDLNGIGGNLWRLEAEIPVELIHNVQGLEDFSKHTFDYYAFTPQLSIDKVSSGLYKYLVYYDSTLLSKTFYLQKEKFEQEYKIHFNLLFEEDGLVIQEIIFEDNIHLVALNTVVTVLNNFPRTDKELFELFGKPGEHTNSDWLSILSAMAIELRKPFKEMNSEDYKRMRSFVTKNFPGFRKAKGQFRMESFILDLKRWAINYPDEVKVAETYYTEAYNNWLNTNKGKK